MNHPDHPRIHAPALSRRDLLTLSTAALTLGAAGPVTGQELPLSSRELWAWVRVQQVLESGIAHLDTATSAPALRAALVQEYRSREALNLDITEYRRTRYAPESVTALLDRFARFAGADVDEIVLTTGATESLNIVANGIPLESGDEVITTTHEHAAGLHPWLLRARRHGVVVRQVPLPSPATEPAQVIGLISEAFTPRTRVLALSHVQYTDGTLLPVRELCAYARSLGVLSVVDGAQSFGALNFSIRELGCDFYAASLAKWFSGGLGTGLLYVRRERQEGLWPLQVDGPGGWNEAASFGLTDPQDADLRALWPAAMRKYGVLFRNYGPLYRGLESALDLQERLGRDRIEARIRELAIYARLRLAETRGVKVLTPNHPEMWAGILAFQIQSALTAEQMRQLAAALAANERVIVRPITHAATGYSALRLSTHIFNAHDDIERLLHGLERHSV